MMRRQLLRMLLLTPIAATASLIARPVQAIVVPGLRTRLETDLRPQMPSDYDFIEQVVLLVKKDLLPLAIVERTYLWARRKPNNRMRYFVVAIRVQAKKLGLDL